MTGKNFVVCKHVASVYITLHFAIMLAQSTNLSCTVMHEQCPKMARSCAFTSIRACHGLSSQRTNTSALKCASHTRRVQRKAARQVVLALRNIDWPQALLFVRRCADGWRAIQLMQHVQHRIGQHTHTHTTGNSIMRVPDNRIVMVCLWTQSGMGIV